MADRASELTRIPGPGEPGFVAQEQKNAHPEEAREAKQARTTSRKLKK
jgi:hypothetical protein